MNCLILEKDLEIRIGDRITIGSLVLYSTVFQLESFINRTENDETWRKVLKNTEQIVIVLDTNDSIITKRVDRLIEVCGNKNCVILKSREFIQNFISKTLTENSIASPI